jgi:hypothetical protein
MGRLLLLADDVVAMWRGFCHRVGGKQTSGCRGRLSRGRAFGQGAGMERSRTADKGQTSATPGAARAASPLAVAPGMSAPRAAFCLSFDAELAWGVLDYPGFEQYRQRFANARPAYDAICAVLDRWQMPATWAFVGRLWDSEWRAPLPAGARQKWEFDATRLPAMMDAAQGEFHAPDLVERVLGCGTPQEIGCHSHSHLPFDEGMQPESVVRAELAACRRAADARGVALTSFVFPYNMEGYHGLLREAGFTCYRGKAREWHAGLPGVLGRAGHFADQGLGMAPPRAGWSRHESGLWNIPASQFLMPLSGARGAAGTWPRLRKARHGIQRAARYGGLFHLWSHPHNFFNDTDRMVGVLSEVLEMAARERDAGRIEMLSMGELARRLGP